MSSRKINDLFVMHVFVVGGGGGGHACMQACTCVCSWVCVFMC